MSESRTAAAPPDDDLGAERAVAAERAPWWERFVTGSSTWIGLILIGLILAFSVLEFESFVSASNARNIATDAAVLLVLATGMTFVIITAGIDLSVGAVLVFSGVVAVKAMNSEGGGNWVTIFVGLGGALLAGLAWGALNGVLTAQARVPPLI